MRVAAFILLTLLLTTAVAPAQDQFAELKIGAHVYHKVTILSVSHTDILFTSDEGMANAKLKNLDPALQKIFRHEEGGLPPVPPSNSVSSMPPMIFPYGIPSNSPPVKAAATPSPAGATPIAPVQIAPAPIAPKPVVAVPVQAVPVATASVVPAPVKAAPEVPASVAPVPVKLTPATAEPPASAPVDSANADRENTKLIMEDAIARVKAIVNQPVREYKQTPDMKVTAYKPGWFYPGALKPDFNTVDVRKTQETRYGDYKYVTSDLNPGVAFPGSDVEFNPMTKYFYEDRTLPKKKLTTAEMEEVNRLYRIIGTCEAKLSAEKGE